MVFALTAEQMMSFRLANEAERLFERPIWFVGENSPNPEGWMLPTDFAKVGQPLRISFEDYVVDSVEVDRVWVRPVNLL